MQNDHSYVIPLDYGNRKVEREFVRNLLQRYDRDSLVGCALFVNNNPYCLESMLCLNFWDKHEDFEKWLGTNYPQKKRNYRFLFSEISDAVFAKGFNVVTFVDEVGLEEKMSLNANEIFLFPDREVMNGTFGKPVTSGTFSVFLSHSSKDKETVDKAFEKLHRANIRAWYDRYEISAGESITDRINEGLRTSDFALLFFSKNFLNKQSGWPMSEANFFFQQRMKEGRNNFIVVNLDLNVTDLPPLLQDYRYIDMASDAAYDEIVDAIRKAQSNF